MFPLILAFLIYTFAKGSYRDWFNLALPVK
jgi:hypothetical protein